MNKKISLGAAIAFALIVAAAVFSITMVYARDEVNQTLSALQQREAEYSKFSEVDREVRHRYYGEIKETELQNSISRGFLAGIGDTHAEYYSAEEYAALNKSDSPETLGSLGIEAKLSSEGYLEITKVYPESPAALRKLEVGSLITSIGETAITAENNEQKMVALSGPVDSTTSLIVRKDGQDEFIDELTFRVVNIPTISWEILTDTKIAYVYIETFESTTFNEFTRVLKEIQTAGGEGLIIDLRGNEGYDMDYASRVIDRIIPSGTIYRALYRDGTEQTAKESDSTEITWPMAVLVNGKTAGVAEIFAQTLKDYNKAKTVGVPTAGKGVSLETIRLSDGSAIRLTTAIYQSGRPRDINGNEVEGVTFDSVGLQPDFEVIQTGVDDDGWKTLPHSFDQQLTKAIEVVIGS